MIWHERHLRRTLAAYFAYYDQARTHLGLSKDAPAGRSVQPPALGRIVAQVILRAPGSTEQLQILEVRYERIPVAAFSEPPGAEAVPKARATNSAVILPENGISLWPATATDTTRTEYSVGTGSADR